MSSLPGLKSFHDLHIWAMSTTEMALTVHVVAEDGCGLNDLIEKISGELRHRFLIVHSTIQIEAPR
ncbi:MAG: hypothetical protein JW843_12050 [Candidatus Aminicenantes bacterium]|nr:hypothetical protein [Candidatus Aminicenantes bacterium]